VLLGWAGCKDCPTGSSGLLVYIGIHVPEVYIDYKDYKDSEDFSKFASETKIPHPKLLDEDVLKDFRHEASRDG
jgi:hypothetical protein